MRHRQLIWKFRDTHTKLAHEPFCRTFFLSHSLFFVEGPVSAMSNEWQWYQYEEEKYRK